MQSFVRSLNKDSDHPPNGLAGVVAELADTLADASRGDSTKAAALALQARRAVAREAAATLAMAGQTPLVMSLDLWCHGSAGPDVRSTSPSVHLACPAGRRRAAVQALAARGFRGSRGAASDCFVLPSLSVTLRLHHGRSTHSPFCFDLAALRDGASPDTRRFGVQVHRPAAEDGLALWVHAWADALWWGVAPDYATAADWQRCYAADSGRLAVRLRAHGLERVAPLALAAAAAKTGAPELSQLAHDQAAWSPPGTQTLGRWLTRLSSTTTLQRAITAVGVGIFAPRPRRGVGY